MKKQKWLRLIPIILYSLLIFYITLFTRTSGTERIFKGLFWEVSRGMWQDIFLNILLFVPLGIFIGLAADSWKNVLYGVCLSVFIELTQYIWCLGYCEADDVLNNTIGTVIGFILFRFRKNAVHLITQPKQRKIVLISLFAIVLCALGYQANKHHYMAGLAALYDRADGSKNLLVLDGKNGYCWNTNVYVSYQEDGSIRIHGTSDKTSWWPIADIKLDPGTYTFSGLSGVEAETVALELETDNHRFAPDVGPSVEVTFTLDETTKLKAYVRVYDGCNCDVTATPVIYKEE